MTTNRQFIFGIHSVQALLQRQPERVLRLLVQKDRQDKKIEAIVDAARKASIPIENTPKQELDRITQEANHQGVLVYCAKPEVYSEADLKPFLEKLDVPAFLLILDSVQDPHNLGACFRTADAAGVHAIIAPKDKAAGITPIVSKVASGAAEVIPFFQITNLARTMEILKEAGVWLYGAAGEADKSVYQTDLKGSVGIVMGAEGEGLRRLTREHCDVLVNIPLFGTVSSLNVSVATGVILFEAARQRKIRK